jgi:hypothetical protein
MPKPADLSVTGLRQRHVLTPHLHLSSCSCGSSTRQDGALARGVAPSDLWHWLAERRFAFAAQQQTLDSYLHAVDLVDARIEQLERSMRETAEQGPWRLLVARLRCLR